MYSITHPCHSTVRIYHLFLYFASCLLSKYLSMHRLCYFITTHFLQKGEDGRGDSEHFWNTDTCLSTVVFQGTWVSHWGVTSLWKTCLFYSFFFGHITCIPTNSALQYGKVQDQFTTFMLPWILFQDWSLSRMLMPKQFQMRGGMLLFWHFLEFLHLEAFIIMFFFHFSTPIFN